MVVTGFVAGIATPFLAKQGGRWILAGAFLVLVTVASDQIYPKMVARLGEPSRRSRVFVPLAARLVEMAWLYGLWKLGVPAGVVVAAGGLTLMHEYVRARGQIAGLKDIGIVTLGERSMRGWIALGGYSMAGIVALTSTVYSPGMVTGIVTIATTAWLLLGVLGFVQLAIVVSAAFRSK